MLVVCTTDNMVRDKRVEVVDAEAKETEKEKEIDKFILNHLCSDIMDELMDSGTNDSLLHLVLDGKSNSKKRKNENGRLSVIPDSKKHRTEASIRVPRMFNHTHSNNLINR
jgi:hypothetical protein